MALHPSATSSRELPVGTSAANDDGTVGLKGASYRFCDYATEILLYLLLVAGPWCFGATEDWAVWSMTVVSWLLGGLLLVKQLLRRGQYGPGGRVNAFLIALPAPSPSRLTYWSLLSLMALSGLILLYGWISILNARSIYYPSEFRFIERRHVAWLPHSFDQAQSLYGFLVYLGLACAFWAAVDWLLDDGLLDRSGSAPDGLESASPGAPRYNERSTPRHALRSGRFLTPKLTRLLWVLCINGALLGIESILQRLDGGDKLLWFRRTTIYPWNHFQFGPFAYRGNAAQYFNLIWPVCLGFCWSLRAEQRRRARGETKVGSGPHLILIPMAILMAACPIISTSRGGALLSVIGLLLLFAGLFLLRRRQQTISNLGFIGLAMLLLAPGFYLGWGPLKKRWLELTVEHGDVSGGRLEQYELALRIIRDYPLFGLGPHSYPQLSQFYLGAEQEWFWQAHNDWLQTLAEWGLIGFALIVLTLILALSIPLKRGTSNPVLLGTLLVSLFLPLIHALFDFPFQIHSIRFTYVILLAVAVSLTFKPRRDTTASEVAETR